MINYNKAIIFIHVPRCGGTSIEAVLFPRRTEENLWMGLIDDHHNRYQTGGLQHLTAEQVRLEVGRIMFDACYRFAVVRNPYSRLVSQYSYTMQLRPDLREFANIPEDASFREYLDYIRKTKHVQWTPAAEFVYSGDELLVHDVFRLEEAGQWKPGLLKQCGVDYDLPRRNASRHRPWQEYYDDECREIVTEMFAEDFRRFGYAKR